MSLVVAASLFYVKLTSCSVGPSILMILVTTLCFLTLGNLPASAWPLRISCLITCWLVRSCDVSWIIWVLAWISFKDLVTLFSCGSVVVIFYNKWARLSGWCFGGLGGLVITFFLSFDPGFVFWLLIWSLLPCFDVSSCFLPSSVLSPWFLPYSDADGSAGGLISPSWWLWHGSGWPAQLSIENRDRIWWLDSKLKEQPKLLKVHSEILLT